MTVMQQKPAFTPAPSKEAAPSEPPRHLYGRLPPHLLLPDGTPDYIRMSLTSRVYEVVDETPLAPAVNLSTRLGNSILLKREDLQPVFSFKIRGAYNLMAHLTEEEKWRGVVACSAGNHAQGVAMAGAKLSIPCTIVMPLNTPAIKTLNVSRLGAKVVLHGVDFDEAKAECTRLAKSQGLTMVPPFDEPYVIAGQATIGVELCRQVDLNSLDAVFCTVGGGGLLAGVASYVKRLAPPHVKVIGVETFDGDAMARSVEKGERVTLDEVGLFSDGSAVRLVGEETWRVCRDLPIDGIVRVSNDEICAAIKDIFEDTRSVAEPAGALAVAGMKRYIQHQGLKDAGKKFVAVVSGANINFSRLRFVAERAELGERKEALLSVVIPEEPGTFLKLVSHIFPRSITEISYRYSGADQAYIYVSFLLSSTPLPSALASNGAADVGTGVSASSAAKPKIRSRPGSGAGSAPVVDPRAAELNEIIAGMARDRMIATDISDNEMAKSHARYLVGGRKEVVNERVFRFEFPDRPGALRKFLNGLHVGWNVSLFHYRNHGADIGKVLAGVQVPPDENEQFDAFLKALGYIYVEETHNEVYKSFLKT